MIQRLGVSSLSFGAGAIPTGRDAYRQRLVQNENTANATAASANATPTSTANNPQIAMQGQQPSLNPQKLNYIA